MKQIALLSVILLLLVMIVQAQQPADLILHNGVVYTVDKSNSTAQAVAIKEGKFVAVGSNADVLKFRGPSTRVIDMRGRSRPLVTSMMLWIPSNDSLRSLLP